MAWYRLPRSLRTYLVIGLVVTVAIVTFSTSRMMGINASVSKGSTFPLLMIGGDSNLDSAFRLDNHLPKNVRSLESATFMEFDSQASDIHTTTAGLSTNPPLSNERSSTSSRPATFSDTIVISPISKHSPTRNHDNSDSFQSSMTQTSSSSPPSAISSTSQSSTQESRPNFSPQHSKFYFPPMNASSSGGRSPRENFQNFKEAEYKRNFIRDMMRHAWNGYKEYAWGFNEVRPVSKMPHTESIFGSEKLGASIVDAIDTLFIMGLTDEYLEARTWIEQHLDLDNVDVDLSVFETNIRYVGGLLSIHALTRDDMYLKKAVEIADKLLPAFDTPSGIPYSNVNLRTGFARNHDWAYGAAILSEFGSMHLEFIYLSYITGDPKYRDKAFKIREAINKAVPRRDGLYNNYINTETGQWLTRTTHISMGALGDSFYEYLIKAYVQTDGLDEEAYQMYLKAIKAFENNLIFTSTQSKLVYFAELKDTSVNHKMDSLACFSGGMLALGASKSNDPIRSHHLSLAANITNTCHESCVRTKSHLGPETFVFSRQADATAYVHSDKYYILRPEILESYFYMWRYTRDPKYRAWGWDFVESLDKYCKAEGGYSGLRDVNHPVIKDDVQQSFFLAEVLKYLYLLFSEDNLISLDHWVFNTEAHPLPIIKTKLNFKQAN